MNQDTLKSITEALSKEKALTAVIFVLNHVRGSTRGLRANGVYIFNINNKRILL